MVSRRLSGPIHSWCAQGFCSWASNDLPSYISDCKMMLYADDTTMYYFHSSIERLMEVLDLDIHRMTS